MGGGELLDDEVTLAEVGLAFGDDEGGGGLMLLRETGFEALDVGVESGDGLRRGLGEGGCWCGDEEQGGKNSACHERYFGLGGTEKQCKAAHAEANCFSRCKSL